MSEDRLSAVTGVGGFTGRHVAQRILEAGGRVVNLTGHPERPTGFGEQVSSARLSFDRPEELVQSLAGAFVLYNTYWIRFARGEMTFDRAVANSRTLISAAKEAGVSRIVHVSITNPSEDSVLPYFRGKALVERAIIESGLAYAILRPAVIFGNQGILINNIAWFLRHTPVFAIPGSGDCQMQPVLADDLASLMVEAGKTNENVVKDAVGPEVYAFNDLVMLIKRIVRSRTLIVHVPPRLALLATGVIGQLLHDVILTPDEVAGLGANLLVSEASPTARARLSEWLAENSDWIGTKYMSELKKHYS